MNHHSPFQCMLATASVGIHWCVSFMMVVLSQLSCCWAMVDAAADREEVVVVRPLLQDRVLLRKGGDLVCDGRTIRARLEGGMPWNEAFALVHDRGIDGGGFLHYQCLAQDAGVPKARAEHYLHLAPMRRMFVSEFSMKLDPDFTVVQALRPDGGPNWCILHQWHQSAPESPAISLSVRPGTNHCLEWGIIHGQSKAQGSRRLVIGVSEVALDRWYHFRVLWNVDPGDGRIDGSGRCEISMSERTLPQDLTSADLRFKYAGPIGYWGRDGHDGDRIREQIGLYQGPHVAAGSHHGISIAHLAVYDLGVPVP